MSLIEMHMIEEGQKANHSFNSDIYSQHILNLSFSNISKSEFAEHFHFLCKECFEVPKIYFIERNKVKYKCRCQKYPIIIKISDLFDKLFYSEEINFDSNKLKCGKHKDEKYIYFCKKCNENKCNKCIEECIEHENKIKPIVLDRKTINRIKYIMRILEEKNQNFSKDDIKTEELEEDNIPSFKLIPKNEINTQNSGFEENISENNDFSNQENYLIAVNKNEKMINEINNEEVNNIINENNIMEEKESDEYYSLNLFSVIIDDYKNYPNYYLIDTIKSIEKYISFINKDYNEINLKYLVNEDYIIYNSFELFGEIFVNNNNENCFLIINNKIIELKRYICLSEIFDKFQIKKWPFLLKVKLVEQKNKIMNNMSFMFYGINTLHPSSDFSVFNTINVTKMSYMFYNCSSLEELPNISNFNTSKVTDMSYMFYNCSSLVKLPNISNFDTSNVTDMSYIFYNCSSLTRLPDISKWNMENISDINNMFANCESLISIPDISIWNLNKYEIRNIDYLFKNCKSLSNLPALSNWKINKNLFTPEIIEGCQLLEINYKENDCIKDKAFCIFKKVIGKISLCLISFLRIVCIIYLIFFMLVPFFFAYYPIYSSFNLVQISYSSNNSSEYFNLRNYTNITYIAQYYNLTNSEFLDKFENKEKFIDKEVNFTSINQGIKFEIELKNYQKLTIISAIICTVNLVLFYILYFNDKLDLIKNSKELILLTLLFLFFIISIALSSIIMKNIWRVYDLLVHYYRLIKDLFNVDISDFIINEITSLSNTFIFEFLSTFSSVVISSIIINLCKNYTERIPNRKNKLLNKFI